jgi:hypothetical protein
VTVYRSDGTGRAVEEARQVLETHRLDSISGYCRECGSSCPCPPANHAANLLADMGVLGSSPANPPLLTYGWRLTFGLTRRPTTRPLPEGRPAIEGEWR